MWRFPPSGKLRLDTDKEINLAVEYARKVLGDSGRVLVRASAPSLLSESCLRAGMKS